MDLDSEQIARPGTAKPAPRPAPPPAGPYKKRKRPARRANCTLAYWGVKQGRKKTSVGGETSLVRGRSRTRLN